MGRGVTCIFTKITLHLKVTKYISLLICCCWVATHAQDTLNRPQWNDSVSNVLDIRHIRQNNFTWYTRQELAFSFSHRRYSLEISQVHDQVFNSTRKQDPFVQLYFKANAWNRLEIRPSVHLVQFTELDMYLNNRNEKLALYGGLRWQPINGMQITPLLGYAWDTRQGVTDQGFSPGLLTSIQLNPGNKINISVFSWARTKFISPRIQKNIVVLPVVTYDPNAYVSILGSARYGSHELDDYSGNSIQRIRTDSTSVTGGIRYALTSTLSCAFRGTAQQSRRRFDYERYQTTTPEFNNLSYAEGLGEGSADLLYRNHYLRVKYEYLFRVEERTYSLQNNLGSIEPVFRQQLEREQMKDYRRRYHQNRIELDVKRVRHNLGFVYTNQYLMYDTPSELNVDDHDELNHIGNVYWWFRAGDTWNMQTTFSGSWRKYAFLFSEKSGDNYTQRTLRLDQTIDWKPDFGFKILVSNAIYVTYNVKDYLDLNLTDRSTRNLENMVEARVPVFRNVYVTGFGFRKEIRQSYLNWREFSETTLDTLILVTLDVRVGYRLGQQKQGMSIELGYRYFRQNRRQHESMNNYSNVILPVSIKRILLQMGPALSLKFSGHRLSGVATVWMQHQRNLQKYRITGTEPAPGVVVEQRDLDVRTAIWRPFGDISLRWNF